MKQKIFLLIAIFMVTGFVAAKAGATKITPVISAFRYYEDINIYLDTPTVIEVPFNNVFIEGYDFAVFDKTTGAFEPHFFRQVISASEIPVTINTSPSNLSPNN